MRKTLHFAILIAALSLLATACGKKKEDGASKKVNLTIEISDVTMSNAELKVTATPALDASTIVKVVDAELLASFTGNLDSEADLSSFCLSSGRTQSLPYSKSIGGLTPSEDYVSMAVAYDAKGNILGSACKTFRTNPPAGQFGDDAGAGAIDENKW